MIPLSRRTQQHAEELFESSERSEAEQLLVTLDDDSPHATRTPESLERLRFAALRLSGGTLAGLRDALELARVDWRDVLMGADFGEDVSAHLTWQPRRFNERHRAAWVRGELIAGVSFMRDARVRIVDGSHNEQDAVVIDLVALEPRPRYRVRTGSGREADVWQPWLHSAG